MLGRGRLHSPIPVCRHLPLPSAASPPADLLARCHGPRPLVRLDTR